MTRHITVYGFGSAFAKMGAATKRAHDIDLLIVHPGTDAESCQFAIACKRYLQDSITYADITMLSNAEEQYCQFIKTAQAVYLGTIHKENIGDDLELLQKAVRLLAKSRKDAPRTGSSISTITAT